MARMITYDEITLEVEARHDLSPEQRQEVLEFIRDFRAEVADDVMERIPEHMRSLINIRQT